MPKQFSVEIQKRISSKIERKKQQGMFDRFLEETEVSFFRTIAAMLPSLHVSRGSSLEIIAKTIDVVIRISLSSHSVLDGKSGKDILDECNWKRISKQRIPISQQ